MENQQTEGTNLAVVMEATLGAKTPPTQNWFNLQPNSYGTFGPSYKKTPRDPISKNQQLQKPMLTDEDSGIPFESDVTKDVIDRFAEGIFRSVAKHCGNKEQSLYRPTGVTSTGYTVGALGDLTQRFLIFGRGFDILGNNGLKMVGAASTNTEIKTSDLATEASPPSNATVELAGWRGAEGDIQLDTDSNLISAVVDFTTWNLNEDQWIFIGGEADGNRFATEAYWGAARVKSVAAHKIVLERRTWDVESKSLLDLSGLTVNLDTVVEARTAGPAGDDITVAAVADGSPAAKAELDMNAAGNSVHIDTIVRAKLPGTDGNLITVEVVAGAPTAAGVLTEIGTHVKLAIKTTVTATTVADLETLIGTSTLIEVKTAGTGATSLDATDVFDSVPLTGGTDATAPSVSEVGDAVTLHFTSGFTTVLELETVIDSDSTKIKVKTAGSSPSQTLATVDDDFVATNLDGGTDGADDGAGKEIDVYFSRWFRNVAIDHDDYLKPSYAFEMTYPTLGDSGEPEYEYMLGNMVDEWVWNIPLTAKSTVNASFVGTRTLAITPTRKTGPATARNPNANAGVSTATNLMRLRIDAVDDTGISTDFTNLKVTVKNNVSPQKQLAQLGANKMNIGKHMVMVEASCIFTSPEVINAIRANTECRLDILMRNEDFGALLDVQSMTLDAGDRKLEKDKSITIESKATGYQNPLSGSTDSMSIFAYLPPEPVDE